MYLETLKLSDIV